MKISRSNSSTLRSDMLAEVQSLLITCNVICKYQLYTFFNVHIFEGILYLSLLKFGNALILTLIINWPQYRGNLQPYYSATERLSLSKAQ